MKQFLRILTLVLGTVFLIVGVIGIFVPVLQGFLFMAIGIYLLSVSSNSFKGWLDKKLSRFPRFKERYDRYKAKVDRLWMPKNRP
jgi:uncharacterized protein